MHSDQIIFGGTYDASNPWEMQETSDVTEEMESSLYDPLNRPGSSTANILHTSDSLQAFSETTPLTAVHLLRPDIPTIFDALTNAIGNSTDVLALTATCKEMNDNRWEYLAYYPKFLSSLFEKALAKPPLFPSLYRYSTHEIYRDSVYYYKAVASGYRSVVSFLGRGEVSTSEELRMTKILNLFQKDSYKTQFSLITPRLSSYGDPLAAKSDELLEIIKKFPQIDTLVLSAGNAMSAWQFKEILEKYKHLQHLKVDRIFSGLYEPKWDISLPTTLKTLMVCGGFSPYFTGTFYPQPSITGKSMGRLLQEGKQLEEIEIVAWGYIGDFDFKTVSSSLKKISLINCGISDTNLSDIAATCSNVVDLTLNSCYNVTPAGFANVNFPSSLECLSVRDMNIGDTNPNHIIASCPKLKSLFLNGKTISL